MTMAAQSAGGAVKSFAALPAGTRLANAAIATVQYLRALVWPVDLAAFYPYPAGGASAAAVAFSAGCMAPSGWAGVFSDMVIYSKRYVSVPVALFDREH